MTFEHLQQLVTRLANFGWCRYWVTYDSNKCYAIQLINRDRSFWSEIKIDELLKEDGFLRIDKNYIYVFSKEV